MSDLIRRDDAIAALWDMTTEDCPNPGAAVGKCMEVLRHLPTADRPQGEWITYYPPMSDMQKHMCGVKEKGYVPDKRFGRSKCSLCGCGRPMYEDNYCPGCGAQMKGASNEAD